MASAQVPAITGISPLSGAPGATVTISGQNFDSEAAKNVVLVGSLRAGILEASVNLLKVLVPAGCSAGYITVTTNGLTARSQDLFIPQFVNSGVFNAASFTRPEAVFSIMPEYTEIIKAADIDMDGWPDILVASTYLQVFLNLHNGRFSEAVSFGLSPYNSGCLVDDFNMDGAIDLVFIDFIEKKLRFFINTGSPGTVSFETTAIS